MSEKYGDIINMPYRKSTKRPQMSMYDRAAQFSSFAALTGHSEQIKETARLTDKKTELNEEQMADLNNKIAFICENIKTQPQITVTYFIPDEKKSGGLYVTEKVSVKKINMTEKTFTTTDGREILLENVEGILI